MKAVIFEENYQMFCYLAYKRPQYVLGLRSGKGLFFIFFRTDMYTR